MSYEERLSSSELDACSDAIQAFRRDEFGHDELQARLVRLGLTDEEAEEVVNIECDAKD